MINSVNQRRKHASKDDPHYLFYLNRRKRGFTAIDCLPESARDIMYSILEPNPKQRCTANMIMNSDWIQNVSGIIPFIIMSLVCKDLLSSDGQRHQHCCQK